LRKSHTLVSDVPEMALKLAAALDRKMVDCSVHNEVASKGVEVVVN